MKVYDKMSTTDAGSVSEDDDGQELGHDDAWSLFISPNRGLHCSLTGTKMLLNTDLLHAVTGVEPATFWS